MIRRVLFHLWAGVAHVGTLLTIAALFYFPVYLDSRAMRNPDSAGLPWAGILLCGLLGPVLLFLARSRRDSRTLPVPELLRQPVRILILCLHLWLVFYFWEPGGRVVWDGGPGSARPLYFVYWVAAGLSAFSLAIGNRGFARLAGSADLIAYGSDRAPAPETVTTRSLHRVTRHPFPFFLILSLWITPLMTLDRLLWSCFITLYAIAGIEIQDRFLEERFGESYRDYQSRVPKWIPLRYKRKPGEGP